MEGKCVSNSVVPPRYYCYDFSSSFVHCCQRGSYCYMSQNTFRGGWTSCSPSLETSVTGRTGELTVIIQYASNTILLSIVLLYWHNSKILYYWFFPGPITYCVILYSHILWQSRSVYFISVVTGRMIGRKQVQDMDRYTRIQVNILSILFIHKQKNTWEWCRQGKLHSKWEKSHPNSNKIAGFSCLLLGPFTRLIC